MPATDKAPLLKNEQTPEAAPLYHDSSQSPRARMFQVFYVSVVVVMVVVSLALSVYRTVILGSGSIGALYLMLGISLLGFVIVELLLIVFIRREELPRGKTWFLYLVGGCVMLEAIFTNVLLFQ